MPIESPFNSLQSIHTHLIAPFDPTPNPQSIPHTPIMQSSVMTSGAYVPPTTSSSASFSTSTKPAINSPTSSLPFMNGIHPPSNFLPFQLQPQSQLTQHQPHTLNNVFTPFNPVSSIASNSSAPVPSIFTSTPGSLFPPTMPSSNVQSPANFLNPPQIPSSISFTGDSSLARHRVPKRSREYDYLESEESSVPPVKKLHAGLGEEIDPLRLSSLGGRSMDDASSDADDESMAASPSSPSIITSPPIGSSGSPTPSTPTQIDAEIDTDQWNLSRLRLEVSDQFQPLLHQLSSDTAKRAVGFDPSILRELQRDYEQTRRGGIIRATWDKSTAYTPKNDNIITSERPDMQQLVIYNPHRSLTTAAAAATLASSNSPSTCPTSPPTPIPVRSSPPIVTEVDDDTPVSITTHQYRSSPTVSSPTSSSSTSRQPSKPIPTSSHNPHRPVRGEKRRRDSDSDLSPPVRVRIEEICDDDHDSKRIKTNLAHFLLSSSSASSNPLASFPSNSISHSSDGDISMAAHSSLLQPASGSHSMPPVTFASSTSTSSSPASSSATTPITTQPLHTANNFQREAIKGQSDVIAMPPSVASSSPFTSSSLSSQSSADFTKTYGLHHSSSVPLNLPHPSPFTSHHSDSTSNSNGFPSYTPHSSMPNALTESHQPVTWQTSVPSGTPNGTHMMW